MPIPAAINNSLLLQPEEKQVAGEIRGMIDN